MKAFFEFIATFSLGRILALVRDLIKGYTLKFYIHVIDAVRGVYFTLLFTIACLLLFFSGFLMLHIALFLILPWTLGQKILLLALLGGLYFIVPIIVIGKLQSRERWLKMSGIKKSIDDLSGKE